MPAVERFYSSGSLKIWNGLEEYPHKKSRYDKQSTRYYLIRPFFEKAITKEQAHKLERQERKARRGVDRGRSACECGTRTGCQRRAMCCVDPRQDVAITHTARVRLVLNKVFKLIESEPTNCGKK